MQKESLLNLMKSKIILDKYSAQEIKNGDSVVVFNTESIYHFYHNQEYKDYVNQCSHISIDGIGIKIVLQILDFSISRFHGPELLNSLLIRKNKSFIIVAGGGEQNNILSTRGLIERYIELPYTDNVKEISNELIRNIQISSLDSNKNNILLLSLGLPKQELVAKKILDFYKSGECQIPLPSSVVPIGAAIDFISGAKRRSGRLWQIFGLEWLPRLIREPRMLGRIFKSILGCGLMLKIELFK